MKEQDNLQTFHGPIRMSSAFQQLECSKRHDVLQKIRVAKNCDGTQANFGYVDKWRWFIYKGVLYISTTWRGK